jgi:hypothetical protein
VKRPPWYVATAWWLDRGIDRLHTLLQLVTSTTIASWVAPHERGDVTAWIYSHHLFYLPGGATFDNGLFDWEVRALSHPELPKSGEVLVAAAGGGREVNALRKRGYRVTGFEPNERLVRGAMELARDDRDVRMFAGDYGDFVEAARGNGGALREVVDREYDLVILGWGSLSHVNREEERRAIFEAIGRVAPRAWVLASFWPTEHHGLRGRSLVLDRTLRSLYAALGAPAAFDQVRFTFPAGMVTDLSRDDLAALGAIANLELASHDPAPFSGSVLLRPRDRDAAQR